jgi:hypothetical protein
MFTVVAYARENNLHITATQASAIGKRAAKISRQNGVQLGQVHDARWGHVHSYREDILEQAWNEVKK